MGIRSWLANWLCGGPDSVCSEPDLPHGPLPLVMKRPGSACVKTACEAVAGGAENHFLVDQFGPGLVPCTCPRGVKTYHLLRLMDGGL